MNGPAKPVRLLALDLDGTLISRELVISPAVRAALGRARAAGIVTTIVTGRMFVAARPYAREIEIEGPIVCYQGAAIYLAASGERIAHTPLQVDVGRRFFERADRDGARALGYLDDRLYAEADDEYVGMYTGQSKTEVHLTPSLAELFAGQGSTKAIVVMEAERAARYVEATREYLGDAAYVTRSNPEYVEVVNSAVHKGHSLAKVAEYYGIGLDETLAIGDSWNDVPLLETAGFGVAMGSGPPELLEKANAVVGDVHHDGVAEAIERFALK